MSNVMMEDLIGEQMDAIIVEYRLDGNAGAVVLILKVHAKRFVGMEEITERWDVMMGI